MLRGDAQDNRDRILETARDLFSERGIDVTMRDVARRAGVGPATLYRRFPTKQLLIDEAFTDELNTCRAIVADGCTDPDPWRGLCTIISEITTLNARNHGFVDAFLSTRPDLEAFVVHRTNLLRMLTKLARRARAGGQLRADFVIDDLLLILLAARGLSATPPADREKAARRFAALAIDALRSCDAMGHCPGPRNSPAAWWGEVRPADRRGQAERNPGTCCRIRSSSASSEIPQWVRQRRSSFNLGISYPLLELNTAARAP